MARRSEGVHTTVRRIDASMDLLTRVLARFGAPRPVKNQLRSTKRAVGDVIARLEMIERRSEE